MTLYPVAGDECGEDDSSGAMSGSSIYLLGTPRVERDGVPCPRPRGRKAWAVLAYLLLNEAPVPRRRLIDLLFAEADDPLRALRWNLSEIRRSTGVEVQGREGLTVAVPAPFLVDVVVLTQGTWVEASALPSVGRPLLEGHSYPGAPGFDAWLAATRTNLTARAAGAVREAAFSQLGAGRFDEARDLATCLVDLDPFDDASHALLVRSLVGGGRTSDAALHVARVTDLFARELGVAVGDEVAAALDVTPGAATTAPASGSAGVHALLEAASAALQAGAVDAGLECFRRAAAEAHCTGDARLKARALYESGSALLHSGRARQAESSAALHSAIAVSETTGDTALAARAYRELAWIELMAGRQPTMDELLDKALSLAGSDPALDGAVSIARGWGLFETGHYARARDVLCRALEIARQHEEVVTMVWALSLLGGIHSSRGEVDDARRYLDEAAELTLRHALVGFSPVPTGKRAETELIDGRVDVALDLARDASSTAHRLRDPCMSSLADRELGLAHVRQGDVDRGMKLLGDARMFPLRVPDTQWKSARALDALCSIAVEQGFEQAGTWIDDLEAIAARTGMTELVAHAYLHRHARGDDDALTAASAIAAGVDNPILHDRIAAASR